MEITNAFRIEELRSRLASKKEYKKLRETYTAKFSEIKDLNTPTLWDHLNFEHNNIKTRNPMMWDRIYTVAKTIPQGVKKVLDIGFGGAQLEDIVNNSYDWYGVDISPKSVKTASSKHPDKHFQISQITNLKLPKDRFDCAIILEVMEHIPPILTFNALKETYRVLKPSGYLIVSVPLNEGLEQMIARGSNPNAHVRVYTPDLIQAELKMGGFKIITTKLLYAFHKYYSIKKIAVEILPTLRHPNNIILLAQKQ